LLGVIPTFDPIQTGSLNTGDVDTPRSLDRGRLDAKRVLGRRLTKGNPDNSPNCDDSPEERRRAKIPPRGFGLRDPWGLARGETGVTASPLRRTRTRRMKPKGLRSFNLGLRRELPTWRQAEPDLGPGPAMGPKMPTAKSSTVKGAKALASESNRRRCRTAKTDC